MKKSKRFWFIACTLLAISVVASIVIPTVFAQPLKDTSTLEMHNPPAVIKEYSQLIYRQKY